MVTYAERIHPLSQIQFNRRLPVETKKYYVEGKFELLIW